MVRLDFLTAAMLALSAAASAQSVQPPPATGDPTFRVGAGDIIQIRVVDDEEIPEKQVRIGADGYISLPTVGRLRVAGLTAEEIQAAVANRLKRLYVDPDVSVSVAETHSQPVTVLGSVKTPGIIQLQGRKTLVEILSAAGGSAEDSGSYARITRQKEFGQIPLPNAHDDPTGAYSIADVNLQTIMDARDPAANIVMMPNDLVNVPKGQVVYVIGEVLKPGIIVLGEKNAVGVLQAVSIASGISKTAKASQTKILRLTPGSLTRTEITVNLQNMMAGKGDDVALQPDDILYVPNNLKKELGMKTLDSLAGAGAMGVIYRL
jgi:polysaccharide export outer membrane protein